MSINGLCSHIRYAFTTGKLVSDWLKITSVLIWIGLIIFLSIFVVDDGLKFLKTVVDVIFNCD